MGDDEGTYHENCDDQVVGEHDDHEGHEGRPPSAPFILPARVGEILLIRCTGSIVSTSSWNKAARM